MSKAALNQATRTMALELKRQATWCVALHPGTTNTDLSKPFQANVKADKLFPAEFTVGQLLDIIDSMDEENSGGFYDWSGQALSF
jgi:NAD(P)-dependent dehydrogenase (short-subunit alcohol dehydrogenase family)